MNRFRFTAACALAAGLAACSSATDSPTGTPAFQLTSADSVQAVAVPAGQAALGDLDVLNALAASLNFDVAPAGGAAFDAAFDAAAACTLDSATYLHTCTSTLPNGLALVRTVEYFDSTGAPMLAFNDTTTASANVVAKTSGVRTTGNGADTVSRARTLTATGLLGHNTTRTWNGTGSGTSSAYWTDSAATRSAVTAENATFTNVVVDLPRSTHPYPASGVVTRVVSGAGTVVRNGTTRTFTFSRTVTVTFNGTEFVPMLVGTQAFTLDLATGKVTKS
ncbi:MAG: hypothetical protein KGN74_12510 [Gemmatimonadota bacterium]|nr:hypothetical protein [Gemmatimonadota bacterium]MDE3215789.1 hypothetical protein [Gemmatimonadota bacterium]